MSHITVFELKERLKTFDKEKDTLSQMSRQLQVSTKTIKKYLNELQIDYQKSKLIKNTYRDNSGKFTFKTCGNKKNNDYDKALRQSSMNDQTPLSMNEKLNLIKNSNKEYLQMLKLKS